MVTKEQLSNVVAAAKANPRVSVYRPYIVAIADERDRLAAQVAELVALLEKASDALGDADDLIRQLDPIDDDDEEGYLALRNDIIAALARIGATP